MPRIVVMTASPAWDALVRHAGADAAPDANWSTVRTTEQLFASASNAAPVDLVIFEWYSLAAIWSDLLPQLKSDPNFVSTLVCVLVERIDKQALAEARASGADCVVPQPDDFGEWVKTLRDLVARARSKHA